MDLQIRFNFEFGDTLLTLLLFVPTTTYDLTGI
jgi:hypothetical protein